MGSDLKRVIEALERDGFVVTRTRKGHYNVSTADGEWITTFAGTPSDGRGFLNALAPLRRRGFQWPPRR